MKLMKLISDRTYLVTYRLNVAEIEERWTSNNFIITPIDSLKILPTELFDESNEINVYQDASKPCAFFCLLRLLTNQQLG